jgi:hypothetical protein
VGREVSSLLADAQFRLFEVEKTTTRIGVDFGARDNEEHSIGSAHALKARDGVQLFGVSTADRSR